MKKVSVKISILGFSLLSISNFNIFLFSNLPHKWEYLMTGLICGFFIFIIFAKWRKISYGFKWALVFMGIHSLISIVLSFILFQKFFREHLSASLIVFLKNVNFIVQMPSKIYLNRVIGSISKVDFVSLINAYHPLIKTLLDFTYAGIIGIMVCQIYNRFIKSPAKR